MKKILGFSPRCTIRTLASSPHIPILSAKLLYNIPVVRQQAQLKWNKPSDQGSEIRYVTMVLGSLDRWYGANNNISLVAIESNVDGHQAKKNIIYRLLKLSSKYQTWIHQPLTDSESKLQMSVVHRPSQVTRKIIGQKKRSRLRSLTLYLEWTSVTSRELPPNPPVLTESEVSHNSVKLTWTHTGSRYMLQMFKTNNKK